MSAVLANESALGLFVFTWTFDGMKCTLMWGPGVETPLATLRSPTHGEVTRPVANPGRFGDGWQPGKKPRAAKAWAQAYADALEGDE